MIRSRGATATADRYLSPRPVLALMLTEDDTSWNPGGEVKQYGAPVGEITVPPHLSWLRPGEAVPPLADADGDADGWAVARGRAAPAAMLPEPSTVAAHPPASSSPQRPRRAAVVRRMGATVTKGRERSRSRPRSTCRRTRSLRRRRTVPARAR